jgi:hypothetical protein
MRCGRTPKPRVTKKQMLRVVAESTIDDALTTTSTTETEDATAKRTAGSNDHANTMTAIDASANADPATVRPSFAVATAENVDQLTASLLGAAGSAVKPVWLTGECAACGERARIEAPDPGRARAGRRDRAPVARRTREARDRRRGAVASAAGERGCREGDGVGRDAGAVRDDRCR